LGNGKFVRLGHKLRSKFGLRQKHRKHRGLMTRKKKGGGKAKAIRSFFHTRKKIPKKSSAFHSFPHGKKKTSKKQHQHKKTTKKKHRKKKSRKPKMHRHRQHKAAPKRRQHSSHYHKGIHVRLAKAVMKRAHAAFGIYPRRSKVEKAVKWARKVGHRHVAQKHKWLGLGNGKFVRLGHKLRSKFGLRQKHRKHRGLMTRKKKGGGKQKKKGGKKKRKKKGRNKRRKKDGKKRKKKSHKKRKMKGRTKRHL